jgi:hypothetical protein
MVDPNQAAAESAAKAAEAANKRRKDAAEDYKKDNDRRAELNKKQAEVMENSRPTPTQEETDLARLGLLHPDDKSATGNPEMPPVAEQQAEVAKAEQEKAKRDQATADAANAEAKSAREQSGFVKPQAPQAPQQRQK